MEIVNFYKRAYDMMMAHFANFAARVEQMCRSNRDLQLKEWLDNQDLCLALNISKRTLQTLRDNGLLPFSKIDHKIYYRGVDVEKFINKHRSK